MRADPKPQDPVRRVHGEGAIVSADPDGMEPTDALEVQRGMPWIRLQELELLVRERPSIGR